MWSPDPQPNDDDVQTLMSSFMVHTGIIEKFPISAKPFSANALGLD